MIHEYGTDKKEIFVILLILLFHWILFISFIFTSSFDQNKYISLVILSLLFYSLSILFL